MRNNDFPDGNDQLFIPEMNNNKWASSGIESFFKLSEGYRWTASIIYDKIKESEQFYKPFMVNVMVFCYRQFLELRIKELTYYGKKESYLKAEYDQVHNLIRLYDKYVIDVAPLINPNYDKKIFSIVRNLLLEFNSIDATSVSFRYPVDKKMRPSHNLLNFDIDNFKVVMDKISNFFDMQRQELEMLELYNKEMEEEYNKSMMGY